MPWRAIRFTLLAFVFAAVGWTARGQSADPDFELLIDAPVGQTTVKCLRGCTLAWWQDGPHRSVPIAQFEFACSGTTRCSSGKVGGWQER